ncbi:hypothetical protein SLZ27_005793 [Pseudomonas aeruginosa]|nr:hypothetical protein [Pseudomonas aeruginosa]
MERSSCEAKLRNLVNHAWDREITWEEIEQWTNNFNGEHFSKEEEQLHSLYALSKFMYFGKRLVREMLKSLYRDHFRSPIRQRIRRNHLHTRDAKVIDDAYLHELYATRFIGVGNPSESGAHLLYYFRQVNGLPKDLFVDLAGAFSSRVDRRTGEVSYEARNGSICRYVFFDDIVGSGTQVSDYLQEYLSAIKSTKSNIDIRFMSLFATTSGLEKLNSKKLFDGCATCLFELDDTYKAFHASSRYFSNPPAWFQKGLMEKMAFGYGRKLEPYMPLGYKDGQLLIGFSHNTPDNVPPIFWCEGKKAPWNPVFIRYGKQY